MNKFPDVIWNPFLLALIAVAGSVQPRLTQAQTFTTTFTTLHSFNGSDGGLPQGGLIVSNNILYGTTVYGGISNNGTVFAINIDGTDFRKLHHFTGGNEGGQPYSELLLSGDSLYGTADSGGTGSSGTVFAVDTNGTGFKVLYAFSRVSGAASTVGHLWLYYSNSDGHSPLSSLVLSSNILYGTATRGGSVGQGTLFAVNTNGTGFTNLHSFTAGSGPTGLLLLSNILYGIVRGSDALRDYRDYGSIFAVNTNGAGFVTLHSFNGSDGTWPNDELVLLNKTLYGATIEGGASGNGTVFKVNIDGTGFATLHAFGATVGVTNVDGARPFSGIVAAGNALYGTAVIGGRFGSGTIFVIKTDGTGFSPVYTFSARSGNSLTNNDGANPHGLVLLGGALYGTAYYGGTSGSGTVFRVTFTPVTAPIIVTEPSNQTNVAGSTANFAVVAKATGPLNYQWLKGTSAMSQRTNSVLTLANVSDSDAASYSVIVSNAAGSVTSMPAVLIVINLPRIVTQPLDRTNVVGSTAVFSIAATGTGPLGYQWLKGTNALPQQKNSTLTLPRVSDADSAVYRVVVTNVAGSVTSSPARLTVINRPQLKLLPSASNITLTWPASASGFTVQFSTNLAPPVRWTAVSPQPVVINGLNTFTNPISGAQKFFRLSQ